MVNGGGTHWKCPLCPRFNPVGKLKCPVVGCHGVRPGPGPAPQPGYHKPDGKWANGGPQLQPSGQLPRRRGGPGVTLDAAGIKSYMELMPEVWDLVKATLSQSSRDRVQYARTAASAGWVPGVAKSNQVEKTAKALMAGQQKLQRAKETANKALLALQEQQAAVTQLEADLAQAREEAAKALGASTNPTVDLQPLLGMLQEIHASIGAQSTAHSVFGDVSKMLQIFAASVAPPAAAAAAVVPTAALPVGSAGGGSSDGGGVGGGTAPMQTDPDVGLAAHLSADDPGGLLAGASSDDERKRLSDALALLRDEAAKR